MRMSQNNFIITDAAKMQISRVLAQEPKGSIFRVGVKGGGCSGFSYIFEVDQMIGADDHIFDCAPYQIVVDDVSIAFLKDAELDFVVQMIGSQFEIRNPNAKSSCGCGVSFSL